MVMIRIKILTSSISSNLAILTYFSRFENLQGFFRFFKSSGGVETTFATGWRCSFRVFP